MKKNNTFEKRLARLEKLMSKKNESNYDISADIFQWFNKRCCDILNNSTYKDGLEDLAYELKYADIGEWTDEAMLDLEANLGYYADTLEEQRDQIEYDLEKLINDTLDHIEFGDIDDLEFAKNKSDWVDKYANPDEYTASLESRVRKLENLVRKMFRK